MSNLLAVAEGAEVFREHISHRIDSTLRYTSTAQKRNPPDIPAEGVDTDAAPNERTRPSTKRGVCKPIGRDSTLLKIGCEPAESRGMGRRSGFNTRRLPFTMPIR